MKRRKNLSGPAVVALAVIICLGIVFYINYFPITKDVVLFKDASRAFWGIPQVANLPVSIDRIFDFPAILIFVLAIIGTLNYLKKPKNRYEPLIIGFALGAMCGGIMGFLFLVKNFPTLSSLGFVIISIILYGLTIGFSKNFSFGIKFSCVVGISTGLAAGIIGIKIGFVNSLIISIALATLTTAVLTTTIMCAHTLKGVRNILCNMLSLND